MLGYKGAYLPIDKNALLIPASVMNVDPEAPCLDITEYLGNLSELYNVMRTAELYAGLDKIRNAFFVVQSGVIVSATS